MSSDQVHLAALAVLDDSSVDPTYVVACLRVLLGGREAQAEEKEEEATLLPDREAAGTFLWDFSATDAAAPFLLACGFLSALPTALGEFREAGDHRTCEVLLGILANLACNEEVQAQVGSSSKLQAALLDQLFCSSDAASLVELCRLLQLLLGGGHSGPWQLLFGGGGEGGWRCLDKLVELYVNTLDPVLSERCIELLELLSEGEPVAAHLAAQEALLAELQAQLSRAVAAEADDSPALSEGDEPGVVPSTGALVTGLVLLQELAQAQLKATYVATLANQAQRLILSPSHRDVRLAAACLLATLEPPAPAEAEGGAQPYLALLQASGRAFPVLADLLEESQGEEQQGSVEAVWILLGRLAHDSLRKAGAEVQDPATVEVVESLLAEQSSSWAVAYTQRALQACIRPRAGVSEEVEADQRLYGCELISEGGLLLRLPQVVMATGQVLFHRFYCKESMTRVCVKRAAVACTWLAAKLEEVPPQQMPTVLAVFHRMELRRAGLPLEPLDLCSRGYEELEAEVFRTEVVICSSLGCVLHVDHPHKAVLTKLWTLEASDELFQLAWALTNDSLRTTLCLQYKSEVVACGLIFLAARKLKVPLPEKPEPWWALHGVSLAQICDVCRQLHSLYSRPKASYVELLVQEEGNPILP